MNVVAQGKSSGKARSAIRGRYVKKATAVRNPHTTVVEGKKGSGWEPAPQSKRVGRCSMSCVDAN